MCFRHHLQNLLSSSRSFKVFLFFRLWYPVRLHSVHSKLMRLSCDICCGYGGIIAERAILVNNRSFSGAVVGIRTRDLILTMDALYRLSYDGKNLSKILKYMKWWAEKDSNLRRRCQQIYSLPPLTAWVSTQNTTCYFTTFCRRQNVNSYQVHNMRSQKMNGAASGIRTRDLRFTKPSL